MLRLPYADSDMYELIQAIGNSYYIESPAKIGLVRIAEDEVCLIDSGSDKEAGRKVRQILDSNGWHLSAIFSTHSNADHIGGNDYLERQTGCRIFSPGIECAFTRHTILEPAFLYGGYPCSDLRHKFLMAHESNAEYLSSDVLPEGMSIIPLPGHFFDMVGFRTSDDVVYLADCLSSKETLDKYGVTFIYDVEAYLKTLETVKTLECALFVPSHATATEDITELADYNIAKVQEVADAILSICSEPSQSERVIQCIFDRYSLTMTMQQYVLVGSTVRSYLSWLKDKGELIAEIAGNKLMWKRV